jgi:hypothetical protein
MTDKKQNKKNPRYIAELKVQSHHKPLPSATDKDIQFAEKQDQSYALMKYRELLAERKLKERLRPREPEIYHHDFFKK